MTFERDLRDAGIRDEPVLAAMAKKLGGRILLPLGPYDSQTLTLGTKTAAGLELQSLGGVAFVPN